jgi:hypothetical protein
MLAPLDVSVAKGQNALLEYTDTGGVIAQHSGVSMFRSFPRLGKSSRFLSASSGYYKGIIYAVGIPLGLGIIICFACVIVTICKFTCLSVSFERRIQIRNSRKEIKNKRYLISSTILLNLSLISLSVSALGINALSETLLNIASLSDGLLKFLKNEALSFVDLIEFLRSNFVNFDSSKFENNFLTTVFESLQAYIPPLFPDLNPLRGNAASMFDRGILITRDLAAVVLLVFGVGSGIFSLMLFAYVAMYVSEALSPSRSGCRVFFHLAFVFVPLLLSWLMFALWNGVGIVLADTCQVLHEYRAVILFTNGSESEENIFLNTGLRCAAPNSSKGLQDRIDSAVDGFFQNPQTNSTLAVAFGINPSDFIAAFRWVTAGVGNLVNCSVLVQYTGQYEQLACGAKESSAVSSMVYLWFGQLLFCMSLTFLFVLLTGGCYGTWSAQVWNPAFLDESRKEQVIGDMIT